MTDKWGLSTVMTNISKIYALPHLFALWMVINDLNCSIFIFDSAYIILQVP